MSLNIMVLESDGGAADREASALADAGHVVLRCHEPDESSFPCRGVEVQSKCPLRSHAVDVALDVRRASPFPADGRGGRRALRADASGSARRGRTGRARPLRRTTRRGDWIAPTTSWPRAKKSRRAGWYRTAALPPRRCRRHGSRTTSSPPRRARVTRRHGRLVVFGERPRRARAATTRRRDRPRDGQAPRVRPLGARHRHLGGAGVVTRVWSTVRRARKPERAKRRSSRSRSTRW